MRFYFDYRSSEKMPHIDTVTLQLKTGKGKVIELDRHTTNYWTTDEPGVYVMEWREPYEWDGENELDLPDPEEFKGAKLIDYQIEDDVPEDYEFEILTCTLVGNIDNDGEDYDIEVDV